MCSDAVKAVDARIFKKGEGPMTSREEKLTRIISGLAIGGGLTSQRCSWCSSRCCTGGENGWKKALAMTGKLYGNKQEAARVS
jgi:hypothetical protein